MSSVGVDSGLGPDSRTFPALLGSSLPVPVRCLLPFLAKQRVRRREEGRGDATGATQSSRSAAAPAVILSNCSPDPQPFSSWPCTLSTHRRYVAGSPPPSICRRGPPELVVRVLPAAFDTADSRQPRMVERITAGSARRHRSPGAGLAATRRRRPP